MSVPVADGGDGMLDILSQQWPQAIRMDATVSGPLSGQRVTAPALFRQNQNQLVLESALANGLALCASQQHPLQATSYGVGQLLSQMLQSCSEVRQVVLGLGGSASTDGGLGALQALGLQAFRQDNSLITTPIGGGALAEIHSLDWSFLGVWPQNLETVIATDVTNPLLGPQGAARVYAPQKGAHPQACDQLEAGLTHIHRLIAQAQSVDHSRTPGSGAAGGLAYGLLQLPGSRIVSGFAWLSDQLGLAAKVAQADLIITAEGCLDETSFQGKAVGELIRLAAGKPVWVLCGRVDPNVMPMLPQNVRCLPFDAVMSPDEAMTDPQKAITETLKHSPQRR